MTALRAALDKLKYEVVEGSEYLQFARTIRAAQGIKINLLPEQLDVLKNIPAISADSRRARARGKAIVIPKECLQRPGRPTP